MTTTPPPFPGLADIFIRNPRRSPESLGIEIDDRLRRVLAHAYENVGLYRERWKSASFHPGDFSGRADLPNIPMIDKAVVVAAADDALDPRVSKDDLITMVTSGTSGCAITAYRTIHEMRVSRRSYLRSLLLAGGRPWYRTMTICSPWLSSRQGAFISKVVKTRHIYPLDSLDKQIETLRAFRPKGMVGQTGGLYLLAREMLRRECRHPLKFLAPTGSTLTGPMARTLADAFAVNPCDLYGSIELGAISWQCKKGNYHVDADRVVVEIVDDAGQPMPLGEQGRVVCTSLYGYAMPFVRYELLDIAALSTRTCDCGCRFPLMEPVQGRINDYLPTARGDLISPHFFFHLYDAAGSTPVKEWRIIQHALDEMTYEYVPEEHFNPDDLKIGMDLIRARFGTDINLGVVEVDSVPLSEKNGKRTCIVSELRPDSAPAGAPWIRGASGTEAAGSSAGDPAPADRRLIQTAAPVEERSWNS